MIKIEAANLEEAYSQAALKLECSITELNTEVIQQPSNGFLGLFKKSAIIVASCKIETVTEVLLTPEPEATVVIEESSIEVIETQVSEEEIVVVKSEEKKVKVQKKREEKKKPDLNETMMPASFVTTQDDDDDVSQTSYYDSYDDEEITENMYSANDNDGIVSEIQEEINELFSHVCFEIDSIAVSMYDENTLLVEFSGKDAALLIGKEGYRYKALSYMIFNWINSKYRLQLRLEIAEFLKNQEESISHYLVGVIENVNRDGRAQTKILDGVLVQIALKQLRTAFPEKYVAIRSTRDGNKFIIINEYNNY